MPTSPFIADASDSFATKRVTLATLGTHFGTGGGGGGGTTVVANPGTDDANADATSLSIAATDFNVADEAVRDLIGYSGRQELHPRTPLPVRELTGDHYAELRALGYTDGTLYGFHSNASGGTVNGTALLNSRDPQDGGAVGLTPETTPETLYFFLNGTTLYAQNFDGGGSETTFTTTTIRAGTPYALANDPDENGKLYMLIDSGNDVYVEELNYNAGGTITHAETVATITPAILNTFAAFGGYEDETDTAADTGSSGGDASGITDIYVAGDFAWFLVTYARGRHRGAGLQLHRALRPHGQRHHRARHRDRRRPDPAWRRLERESEQHRRARHRRGRAVRCVHQPGERAVRRSPDQLAPRRL